MVKVLAPAAPQTSPLRVLKEHLSPDLPSEKPREGPTQPAPRPFIRQYESIMVLLRRGILALAMACPLFSAGCAKVGEPQPPEIRVPKPAVDLAARQSAGDVVLTVSIPSPLTCSPCRSELFTITPPLNGGFLAVVIVRHLSVTNVYCVRTSTGRKMKLWTHPTVCS